MDDMLQWAQPGPPGVGEGEASDLMRTAQAPPPPPDPRGKKPRHRPNKGRKRRFIGPALSEPPWDMLRETGYPIPPGLECMGRVPAQWRAGKTFQAWRRSVLATYGDTCHLCGHAGATTADHLVPLSLWGNQPYVTGLARPAHGIEGCSTCGLKCNSSRGNREYAKHIRDYKPPVAM